jgi:uncharacterized membrane protein YbhN (UPF0104 family)
MLGAAILVAVIYAAVHLSEGRAFVAVAERAKPWWLVLAVCLQGATYLAQGEIFRRVPRAAGYPLPAAYELSLANQALPSAGIGSTIVVARVLERRAVPRAGRGRKHGDQHRVVSRCVCGVLGRERAVHSGTASHSGFGVLT